MTEAEGVLPIRRRYLHADVSLLTSVTVDRAGNPVLTLKVRLLPGTEIVSTLRAADGRRTVRTLAEPLLVSVNVDADLLAGLAWRAARNAGCKAKAGALLARCGRPQTKTTEEP